MKIWVEREVSNHPNSCLYYFDGSFKDGRVEMQDGNTVRYKR